MPSFSEVARRYGLISVPCCLLASVIAAAVDPMGCWSPCPAARQRRLPRAGVVGSGHATALDPPCGPHPRRRPRPRQPDRSGKRGRTGERIRFSFVAGAGCMGATASALPAAAPSFAVKGGCIPGSPRNHWRAEVALDVSAICATLGADGDASGGWPTTNGFSGAALSGAFASCRSLACRGVDCCWVGSAMVVRPGVLIEAVASKVESFDWFRPKVVIVHNISRNGNDHCA